MIALLVAVALMLAATPERARWLRGLGLAKVEDFLRLEALIISGHPGRSVSRLSLGGTPVYLKRESGVRRAPRARREAQVLAALEREGLPAPRWLAAGEDGRGGAFLLVEAVPAARPLAAALREAGPSERLKLAVSLGKLLARLHGAGFWHRDLYAKHILVSGPSRALYLLDWQRARRAAVAPRAARVRDLACLHATLDEASAGPRARLACVRAYLGEAASRSDRRRFIAAVEALAARLRQRRHVREKRQGEAAGQQAWTALDGEALAVTPALAECGGGAEWLELRRQPVGPTAVSRRWVVLGGGRQVLLVRGRRRLSWLGEGWRRLRGRAMRADELRLSTLLWRLERHGVAAPRVLAAGQRCEGGVLDSFLLTAPLAGTVRLETWLGRAEAGVRERVLGEVGAMLARLHEACCYLGAGGEEALAVQVGVEGVRPVVANAERICPQRRPRAELAREDLRRLEGRLGEGDWRAVREGYGRRTPLRNGGSREGEAPAEPRALTLPGPSPLTRDDRPGSAGASPSRTSASPSRLPWRVLHRPDWPTFAGPAWLDDIMSRPLTDRVSAKQGRSTGRLVLTAPDGRRLVVYLKRHHRPPWRERWLSPQSPAMREYAHLEWAHSHGLPVPRAVAAGESADRRQSFLAVEELADMLPLPEALALAQSTLAPADFRTWKRGLAAEVARLARLLHDRRHFHKDLYLCHFYVPRSDATLPPTTWRGRVWLIDLHRLAHHARGWRLWQIKDLAQLLYSSDLAGLDAGDRAAFWAAYRGPGPAGWTDRLLRRLIALKARLYRRHNRHQGANA